MLDSGLEPTTLGLEPTTLGLRGLHCDHWSIRPPQPFNGLNLFIKACIGWIAYLFTMRF